MLVEVDSRGTELLFPVQLENGRDMLLSACSLGEIAVPTHLRFCHLECSMEYVQLCGRKAKEKVSKAKRTEDAIAAVHELDAAQRKYEVVSSLAARVACVKASLNSLRDCSRCSLQPF